MSARDHYPAGAPCWVDLLTSDAERSRAFYTQLFGWTAGDPNPEFGGYFNFAKNGVRVAGAMQSQPGMGPDGWSIYLATDDAAKTLDLATAHGGQVEAPASAVGDLGTMAVITDPDGARIGLWQPKQFSGSGLITEAGTPSWWELHTRDYQTAVNFYRDVLGWETQTMGDTPEFRYTVLKHGEEMLAGIMDASSFLPAGEPARWSVYFGSDDADASLADVTRLGGSVVLPAEDTPYGRLAEAADPTGAHFKLVAPNAQMPAQG